MTMTPVGRAALSLLFAAGLQACGSSSESKAGAVVNLQTLTSTIPVTRAACTPFGAAPSVVSAALDGAVNPSCLPGGEKLERWQDADGTMRDACLFEPAAASTDHKLPLVIYLHRSEEHTSELQSLMRQSYAVFCLKKKKNQ